MVEKEQIGKHYLPVPLTPLLGREQEVAEVSTLLRSPEIRLLTLTGTGGVGKTHLALHTVHQVCMDFADGVSFVSLAPVRGPDLLVSALAHTLGLRATASHAPVEQLIGYLHHKNLLLLLDNFEQVIQASPTLTALLECCPRLKLLVTSREALHVRGEHVYLVCPLPLPNPGQLAAGEDPFRYAAIALFLQRAQAVKRDFQLTSANAEVIAAICRCLDGLPLALELAAARIRLLPPHLLLAGLAHRLPILTQGLRDAPARQQTLHNTLQWSYDLLTPAQQRLFRLLAVFVGGCSFEAVTMLSKELGDEPIAVLEGIESLLSKNLIQRTEGIDEEPRLLMLETIREYGVECVRVHGEMEHSQQAHCAYYLALAQQARPKFIAAPLTKWLERLEQEHGNLRAAMHWALEQGETQGSELALQLGEALCWLWLIHGHWQEGQRFLEDALTKGGEVAASVRAKALQVAGWMALCLGESRRAKQRCEQSLMLLRNLGETQGRALCLYILGMVALYDGQLMTARSLLEESLSLWNVEGEKAASAYALYTLALLACYQGEYSRASALYRESQGLHQELENRMGVAEALRGQAWVLLLSQGVHEDPAAIHSLLTEALTIAREINDQGSIADCCYVQGLVWLSQGNLTAARSLLEECERRNRQLQSGPNIVATLVALGRLTLAEKDGARAAPLYEEALVRAQEGSYLWLIAPCLEGVASVAAGREEFVRAAQLWAMAALLREIIGIPLPPMERADYERWVTSTRQALGEKMFATAWAAGRSVTVEHILATRGAQLTQPELAAAFSPPLEKNVRVRYSTDLTRRELEVLSLVTQGLTDMQVAERLVVSPHTVHVHINSVYRKVGVNTRSALTRYALEHRLV
jgi:predicted ATPase/DNA-binding CsgD family transcriptional regulator